MSSDTAQVTGSGGGVGVRHPEPRTVRLVVAAVVGAASAGAAASLSGPVLSGPELSGLLGGSTVPWPLVPLGTLAIALFVGSAYRPIFGTYSYLLTLPFLVGIGRGAVVPGLRLNEVVLVLVLSGACLGGYLRFLRGDAVPRLRPRPLDVPLLVFVLLATVWPVASMMLRGQSPQGSDLAAVLPACKAGALFVFVRLTVRTEQQLARCLRLVIWTVAGVALVAVLQVSNVGPVVSLLESLWVSDPGQLGERGTSTMGSSIATGDCIILALSMLSACVARGLLSTPERIGLGFVLAAGVFAAGQFSTWIAALVAGILLLRRFPELRRAAIRMLPVACVAGLVGAPAVVDRLASFGNNHGLPRSWLGRWDNLTHFYLPELADFRFVLGVSPNSVLPAPEIWRELIYLESGYLHFLWAGGIPLLVGFVWLSVVVVATAKQLGERAGPVGAAASTLGIAWWIVLVLSVIDTHLMLRGFGDLLFFLLAVASGRFGDDREIRSPVAAGRTSGT